MSIENLKQTGRTTRMIEHAQKLDSEGRAVYIIVDSEREVRRIEMLLGNKAGVIKVETPESVGNLDWSTMRLRNAFPNVVVLVDHHAIEDRFAGLVQMLHAYDLLTSNPQKSTPAI